jgi:hypothetical protein
MLSVNPSSQSHWKVNVVKHHTRIVLDVVWLNVGPNKVDFFDGVSVSLF